MYQFERRSAILGYAKYHNTITVKALCDSLSASLATIRRDLNALAEEGLIIRTHGGAIHRSAIQREMPLGAKKEQFIQEKAQIAALAAGLVQEGDIIALNGGTTTLAIAKALRRHNKITVVTNSLEIATMLCDLPVSDIILFGGVLRSESLATGGQIAAEMVKSLTTNCLFLGVTAIDEQGDCWVTNEREAAVELAMVERAQKVFIVADHSKFNKRHLFKVTNLCNVFGIITDSGFPQTEVEAYRRQYGKLVIYVAQTI